MLDVPRVGVAKELVTKRLRRWHIPLSAAAALAVVGFGYSLLSYRIRYGSSGSWTTPDDFWSTYQSSVAIAHGHFSQVYSRATGLVTFPAISYLLAPVAALTSALHLGLGQPAGPYARPSAWLVAGPYEMILSTLPIFAVDRWAALWKLAKSRRWVLALAQAAVLANVTVIWGHPEDAISVGLVLYATLAIQSGGPRRASWLLGIAVAFQPLALLAVPMLGARLSWREAARSLPAVIVPSIALLAPIFVAEPLSVWHAVVEQPNYPFIKWNHATPLTRFAPAIRGGPGVMAGPSRLVALAVSAIAGVGICRRVKGFQPVLWTLGLVFFIRLVFEVTIADYYIWPVLAVTLLLSARRGLLPLVTVAVAAILLTWFQQLHWQGMWGWWALTMGSLAFMLVLTRPRWVLADVRELSPEGTPLRASRAQIWSVAALLGVLISGVDALLGHRVILIGLLIIVPCCALLTGRWTHTALGGSLAVGTAVALGVPDRIWGTATHFASIGAVATVTLIATLSALVMERRAQRGDTSDSY